MKILFLLRSAFMSAYLPLLDHARSLGLEVKILRSDRGIGREELLTQVKDVDIIVVDIMKIDRGVLNAAVQLKYIIKFGAGYDNIDVEFASQRGIPITYAPGQNADSVADLAFGLMLGAARSIPLKDKEVKANIWEISMGYQLTRKRLGIIGFGAIGKAIAERAKGFKMDTIAFGHFQDHKSAKLLNVRFVDVNELFSTSDFVILCTSLSEINREIVNRNTLRLMKPNAFIINIARGGLVKEEDLIAALKQEQIGGAALDVFVTEPPQNDLSKLLNVISTPHIGGATFEAIENISLVTLENLSRFLNGEELGFLVRPNIK